MHTKNSEITSESAFSLIELAIVLVVIGLLVGGLVVMQSMTRQSQLQGVVSDYQKFKVATAEFIDQYISVPGDMPDATDYWGTATNGDGDKILDIAAAASATGEDFQFWRHLVLAGRITGVYTGVAGSGSASHSVAGTNVPAASYESGAWEADYLGVYGGDTTTYAYNYGNYFRVGTITATAAASGALLKPEEAWNIDTKTDDGQPGKGTVVSSHWNSACATSTTNADYNGAYNLTNQNAQCALYFVRQF